MNCFSRRARRTVPTPGSSKNELVPSKPPRINGWSWPLQGYQLVAWLVYAYFGIVCFGIYTPLLPIPWNVAAYSVSFAAMNTLILANATTCYANYAKISRSILQLIYL